MAKLTVLEAYDKVMEQVAAARDVGIQVDVIPTGDCWDDSDPPEADLPMDKWCTVCLHCSYEEAAVYESALHNFGIYFDTGFGGARDWEIDWSFHVYEK